MTYALTWFTMATDKFTVYCTQYIRLGVGLLSWPILFVLFINIVSTGRSPVSLETPLFLTDFLYSFSWCITANISIERCLLVAKQRKCENSVSQNFLIVDSDVDNIISPVIYMWRTVWHKDTIGNWNIFLVFRFGFNYHNTYTVMLYL